MSVLLVGLDDALGPALIARLMRQGDEVRVLEDDPVASRTWRSLGVHIASGPATDADLIERAAQNVRTIVVGLESAGSPADLVGTVVEGGGLALATMRIVAHSPDPEADALARLRASPLDYVWMISARRSRLGRRRAVGAEALAAAIDAADDLAGNPRLELDLTEPGSWRELRLEPPP